MSEMYWFNYKTGEYEYITCPQDFAPYIPQSPAAQNLYKLYVENMNLSPIEAAQKVLEAAIGKAVQHALAPDAVPAGDSAE